MRLLCAMPVLLAALLGAAAVPAAEPAPAAPAERSRPLVGAIRWDAWSGGDVTAQVERSLGPKEYHFRLPFFAKVLSDDKVEIRGGSQEVMDREIAYAADAGIDYWAFLMYPDKKEGMTVPLRNYLASKQRERIRFALILHQQIDSGPEVWPGVLARIVGYLKEPGYQTVLGGRPLVYMFHTKLAEKEAWRFKALREAAAKAGLKDPYLVYMGFHPKGDWPKAKALGFDALSAYAMPGAGTYAHLAQDTEKRYWEACRELGVPVIPLATAGWDKRPRMDHPVSWEKDADYHKKRTFVETARPEELAAHLRRAVEWTAGHPKASPAQSVIVYAWNENDEGGWLAPTLKPDGTADTSRLDAVRKVLRPEPAGKDGQKH